MTRLKLFNLMLEVQPLYAVLEAGKLQSFLLFPS